MVERGGRDEVRQTLLVAITTANILPLNPTRISCNRHKNRLRDEEAAKTKFKPSTATNMQ